MAIKWSIVNDQSNANYDVGKQIIYNAEVLKSNFFDYNDDAYSIRQYYCHSDTSII